MLFFTVVVLFENIIVDDTIPRQHPTSFRSALTDGAQGLLGTLNTILRRSITAISRNTSCAILKISSFFCLRVSYGEFLAAGVQAI